MLQHALTSAIVRLFKNTLPARLSWLRHVILATQEAEIRRI
jgi:hypothetical protein